MKYVQVFDVVLGLWQERYVADDVIYLYSEDNLHLEGTNMEAVELRKVIQAGESSVVQFKRRVSDAYKVGTEMVAFTNSQGGILIIGVDDKTGDIDGLSFEEIQATNQLLANAASDNVKAPIYIFTETILIDGGHVIVAQIPPGVSKPHMDNKGLIWVKNGSDKRKVVAKEEIARLLQSSGNLLADEEPIPGTSVQDIDEKMFAKFLFLKTGKKIEDLDLPPSAILENMGMLKEGLLTLGGLLLVSKNPQKFRPMFNVQCTAIAGTDLTSTVYRDREDPFVGNLSELYAQTISFIKRNLKKIQTQPGFNSRQSLEIPIEAIEELLVNALVHRDYFILASIKVFIFDDGLEIVSPGRLPNTLTI